MTWTSSDLAGLRIAGDTSRRAERRSNARGAAHDSAYQIAEIAPPAQRQAAPRGAGRPEADAWPWKKMNKTESRFAREHLVGNPDVVEWQFEPFGLRLGEGLHYHPDFWVVMSDGRRRIVEVKGGYVREDAAAKFKAAAMRHTLLAYFEMWQWKGGAWSLIREI